MLRYEIDHPVVNDADRKIWNAYGVDSWPTVALIDPEGFVVAGSKIGAHLPRRRPRHRQAHPHAQGQRHAQREADPLHEGAGGEGVQQSAVFPRQGAGRQPNATGCSSPTARTIASSSRTSTARRSPSPAPARPATCGRCVRVVGVQRPAGFGPGRRHPVRGRPQEPPDSRVGSGEAARSKPSRALAIRARTSAAAAWPCAPD